MSKQLIAANVLRSVGVLLCILGLVHLAAIPHIPSLLGASNTAIYERAVGPTLLNHVLVGILLLPLGYTTWLAAGARLRGENWAIRILAVNTIAVLSLPLSLVVFMRRPEYLTSPLFRTGVGLVAVISVLMTAATLLLIEK